MTETTAKILKVSMTSGKTKFRIFYRAQERPL
jgi:hypothetical protein